MFWKHKHRVQANVLAASLFDEFVKKPIHWDETLHIDTAVTSVSGQKVRLYQFASVLLAVLDAERRDASFSPVREGLEQRFFPPTFAEGASQLEAVRQAMKNLTELIQPEGQPEPMSWAIRWLSDVGIQQDNPAVLMMFAIRWPNHFAAALEALRKFKPVIEHLSFIACNIIERVDAARIWADDAASG